MFSKIVLIVPKFINILSDDISTSRPI